MWMSFRSFYCPFPLFLLLSLLIFPAPDHGDVVCFKPLNILDYELLSSIPLLVLFVVVLSPTAQQQIQIRPLGVRSFHVSEWR